MGVSESELWSCLSADEMNRITDHGIEHFGPCPTVWHEIVSDIVHLDVLPFPPNDGRASWVFMTMGMSALPMNVPKRLGIPLQPKYAELYIVLPANWLNSLEDIHGPEGSRLFRPVGAIKGMAHYVHKQNTFFIPGHTLAWEDNHEDAGVPRFTAALIHEPLSFPPNLRVMKRGDGENLFIYSVTPITQAELDYKLANGADALLARLSALGFGEGFAPERPCAIAG